jgi:hypothetical protein
MILFVLFTVARPRPLPHTQGAALSYAARPAPAEMMSGSLRGIEFTGDACPPEKSAAQTAVLAIIA